MKINELNTTGSAMPEYGRRANHGIMPKTMMKKKSRKYDTSNRKKDTFTGENAPPPVPVTKKDTALKKQAKHLKMKSVLAPGPLDQMVGPNKAYMDKMDQTQKDANKLSKAAGIDPNLTRNAVAKNISNADPRRMASKFGRNKTENAPGSIAAKINWGGKNKDTKVKKTKSWFQKAKAAVFGEEGIDELKIVKPDPKDTMGIKRNQMPQVATKDYPEFMDYLKDNGAEFKKETVPAKSLKAVQGEFSDQGVEKALRKSKLKKASIVSSDNYIIDGHHRWVAALNTRQDVDIIRVNMPAKELLELVKNFNKTTYKDIYTEKWSKKYKKSINCSNPKGFSQKAHCAGRKKNESVNEGYKLYLERGRTKDVLHITDTSTGHRTEVRGKSNYETKYDPNDRLHKLLDRIGKAANISELLNGEPVGINPNHPDGSDAKDATTKAFNEHGLVPMYSTMKAYGMRKKTTNGQKHFVTDDVDEDTPLSFLKRKASHMVYSGQYERAAKKLHDILTRKYKETGGKLRHALGYYAHMLSRQTGEKLNWRELQQEYLDTYGNMYFEDVTERKLTKGEEKKKEKYVKGMKKAKDDFKKRYGDEAEAVMYATATKMAKKK